MIEFQIKNEFFSKSMPHEILGICLYYNIICVYLKLFDTVQIEL